MDKNEHKNEHETTPADIELIPTIFAPPHYDDGYFDGSGCIAIVFAIGFVVYLFIKMGVLRS